MKILFEDFNNKREIVIIKDICNLSLIDIGSLRDLLSEYCEIIIYRLSKKSKGRGNFEISIDCILNNKSTTLKTTTTNTTAIDAYWRDINSDEDEQEQADAAESLISEILYANESILAPKYPHVKVGTENDYVIDLENNNEKLDIIDNYFNFKTVEGVVNSYSVNLTFDKFTILGEWDEDIEEMTSIFKSNDIEIEFNYHPLGPFGGLDIYEFKSYIKEVDRLFNNPDEYEKYKIDKDAELYNL